jgi:hypothetical protein
MKDNPGFSGSNYNAANEQGNVLFSADDDRNSLHASKIGEMKVKRALDDGVFLPPSP